MITIYHNPRCGTSRTVLQTLQDRGLEPHIVEYLKEPLSKEELRQMIAAAGLTVREAIRSKEAVYGELTLDNPDLTDDALLEAMAANPILMNRPFVVTEKGTRLCRPADQVDSIL